MPKHGTTPNKERQIYFTVLIKLLTRRGVRRSVQHKQTTFLIPRAVNEILNVGGVGVGILTNITNTAQEHPHRRGKTRRYSA